MRGLTTTEIYVLRSCAESTLHYVSSNAVHRTLRSRGLLRSWVGTTDSGDYGRFWDLTDRGRLALRCVAVLAYA